MFDVLPWALFMAIAAIAVFVAAQIENRRIVRNVMVAVAVLLALLGAVSILSVGLGFLLIAALAAVAAVRLSSTRKG